MSPWVSASACSNSGCVQLQPSNGAVLMRDSKDPDGPVLTFTTAEVAAFLDGAKRGEFDDLAIT